MSGMFTEMEEFTKIRDNSNSQENIQGTMDQNVELPRFFRMLTIILIITLCIAIAAITGVIYLLIDKHGMAYYICYNRYIAMLAINT